MKKENDYWIKTIATILESCHAITGKGSVNQHSIAFFARELDGLSIVSIKAAFNHYAVMGLFPTVADVRAKAGVKTEPFDQGGQSDEGGQTYEDKIAERQKSMTDYKILHHCERYAVELWAPKNVSTESEALMFFKDKIRAWADKGFVLDENMNKQIRPSRVQFSETIVNGNKKIEVKIWVYKALVYLRKRDLMLIQQ